MSLSKNYMRRALAVGAASALGLSGLLIASPAIADSSDVAPTEGAAFAAFAAAAIEGNSSIQGVAKDADGNLVVIAVAGSEFERSGVEEILADYSNVTNVKFIGQPLESYATTDVVGGAGYYSPKDADSGYSCSIGYSAWNKDGADAIVSAGHCTQDGALTETELTRPSKEPAHTGIIGAPVEVTVPLGTFGFSQFGGIGHTAGIEDTDSTDVSVINNINPALSLKPAITDWSSAGSDDLTLSATNVTAVGNAVVDMQVSKSGRTTGLTSDDTIDEVEGWALVSGRLVYGFGISGLEAAGGDSGGAVFSGTTALGILSGGSPASGPTPAYVWAADLQNALDHTDGYAVKLFIEAPVVATANGSDVERGTNITGTAAAGTTITVTPANGTAFDVVTDTAGTWSFPAPSALGTYDFTVQAKKGFDASEITASSVKVVPAPLLAPVITTPANGAQLTADVTTLTGTGLPGATVTVAGDATGTATVATNGSYSFTLSSPLSYGSHELTVTQKSEGVTSPAASTSFAVVLESPAVTSPAPGSSFPLADAPTTVSGTGIDGAMVTVSIDGVVIGQAEVVDGVWTLEIDSAIAAGTHTLTVTQALEEVTSAAATTTFSVVAPVVPDDNDNDNDNDNGNGNGNGNGNDLAETGVESLGFIGGAAALLLAGGLILVMRRRIITE